MKRISFIIPAYNCEKYIRECIESIIKQDGIDSFLEEIIIINDGSKDDTENIVKEIAEQDKRVKYIYQENSGAPTARNKGILSAKGDLLVFLDSDDKLSKDYFKKINLTENNYDLILGNYDEINENGEFLKNCQEYLTKQTITKEKIFELCVNDPKPGSKIYNRKIIIDNKIMFDDLKIGQDTNFLLKYLLFCNNVLLLNEVLYEYRIVNGSISHTYTLKNLKIIDTFEVIKKFYHELGKDNIYTNYIKYAELQHYYFQSCKLRLFDDICDRKIIFYTFKKKYKELNIDLKKCFSKKNANYLKKFYLRQKIGFIFTSEFYHKTYKWKRNK